MYSVHSVVPSLSVRAPVQNEPLPAAVVDPGLGCSLLEPGDNVEDPGLKHSLFEPGDVWPS